MEKWIEDTNYIVDFLKAHHPDMFGNCNEDEFYYNVEVLKENLKQLDDIQIKIEIIKLIASLHNEHTGIDNYSTLFNGPIFPFETMLFDEKLYITGINKKHSKLLGSEIVKLNNHDISQVISKLSEIIPHNRKELISSFVPQLILYPKILYGLSLTDHINFQLSLVVKINENCDEIILNSINPNEFIADDFIYPKDHSPLSSKEENKNNFYWYEMIKGTQCIYINYNRCNNMENKSFQDFTKEVFQFIENRNINKIIIDLRQNKGGNSAVFQPMVNRLMNHPLNRADRLYSLISTATFSSGVMNAADMKFKTNATLIGTATGGLLNGPGDTVYVKSPNYHLQFLCPTKIINAKANYDHIPTDYPNYVMPDIEIKDNIDDYINGIDTQLEYILKI